MQLIITIRKEVEDQEQAEAIYRAVRLKLEDYADIEINGHVTNHFQKSEELGPQQS